MKVEFDIQKLRQQMGEVKKQPASSAEAQAFLVLYEPQLRDVLQQAYRRFVEEKLK